MEPLAIYTPEMARRVTGLSSRTLRRWEAMGVFTASFADDRPERTYRRLYTARDVVGLTALALLWRRYRLPLDQLRIAGQYLVSTETTPLSELRLGVAARSVVIADQPGNEPAPAGEPDVAWIDLPRLEHELAAASLPLRERPAGTRGKVTRRPEVMGNAWVIAGTRIPTAAIRHLHEAGYDTAAIIREYSDLSPEDIAAALAHEQRVGASTAA